jgi:hypothetical protein
MIKTTLFASALAVALSAPAMAGDFHALAGLQGTSPAPLQDEALAATEGGLSCISVNGSIVDDAGAVCIASDVPTSLGTFASFTVSNGLPVHTAFFLGTTGL